MKEILENIIMIIRHEIPDVDFDDELSMNYLELDSVSYIQIIVAIEEFFKIEFSADDLIENRFNTLYDVAKRVESIVTN